MISNSTRKSLGIIITLSLLFSILFSQIPTQSLPISSIGGEQLGLGVASASGDILPSTIGQAAAPSTIAFSDNGTHYIFNNWQLIFSYSKTSYTDLIFSPTGELLADSSSFQLQVDAYKFDIAGSVAYEKISDTEYELTRTFLAVDYDATLKLIYNITMERNKLTIDFLNGSKPINKNVAFNWLQSLLTNHYVEIGDQLTFDSGKKQITFDWSDAAAYTHAITVSDTAKGKQAEIKFTVGAIARNAHIVIDPSTVGSTTTDQAIDLPSQRKIVYAASRFWVFYSDDGDGIVYTSSLDGITWTADQTLKADSYYGESVSIWYDSDNICIAYSEEAASKPIEYCQFTPYDNGTLSAQTAWQTVIAGDAGTSWDRLSVCKDTNGYPYISYLDFTAQDAYVTRSNQNDGTWTSCNFTTALITTNQYWNTAVVPQLNGKVMAIYAYGVAGGATIKSKVWNGSTWGSENATTQDMLQYWDYSAVSTSDGVVHLVFREADGNDITYTHYHDGGTVWQTEEVIYAGTDTVMVPVISKTLDDNLYCFWMGDPDADHIYYKAQVSGVWDTSATEWLTEVDIHANSLISCTYSQTSTNYIPVIWLVEDGANYDVRFGALERDLYDDATWWDEDWLYRAAVPLVGGTENLSNYVLTGLEIYYDDDTKTGSGQVNCAGLCDVDFDDIRIKDDDGTTDAEWAIESLTDGDGSGESTDVLVVSVAVNHIVGVTTDFVWVYFGNPSALAYTFPMKNSEWVVGVAVAYQNSGWYDSADNRTYITWQGVDYSPMVSYYDHTNQRMASFASTPAAASAADDAHYVPVVAVSPTSGRVHCMYSGHSSPQFYNRTPGDGLQSSDTWYESFTDTDSTSAIYGAAQRTSQSFGLTSLTAHTIYGVKFNVVRTGGLTLTGYVELTAADANHKPLNYTTGGVLATGYFNVNRVPVVATWITVGFNTPVSLSANTEYCWIIYLSGGDSSNKLSLARDATSSAYSNGRACGSSDSGATWSTPSTTIDICFYEGYPIWGMMMTPLADATYPHLDIVDVNGTETMYYTARSGTTLTQVIKTSTDDGMTWSNHPDTSSGSVKNAVIGTAMYMGDMLVETNGNVHLTWEIYRAKYDNVYYMKYDAVTDNRWEDAAGNDLAIPLSDAQMDSNCLVWTGSHDYFSYPKVVLDSDNVPCISWGHNTGASGDYEFSWYQAGVGWTTPTVICDSGDVDSSGHHIPKYQSGTVTDNTAVIDVYLMDVENGYVEAVKYSTSDGGDTWTKDEVCTDSTGILNDRIVTYGGVSSLGRIKNAVEDDLQFLYVTADTVTGGAANTLHGWPNDVSVPYLFDPSPSSHLHPLTDDFRRSFIGDSYVADRYYGKYYTDDQAASPTTDIRVVTSDYTCETVAQTTAGHYAYGVTQYAWDASAWPGFHLKYKILKAGKTSIMACFGVLDVSDGWDTTTALLPQEGMRIRFDKDAEVSLSFQIAGTENETINNQACETGDVYVDFYYQFSDGYWELLVDDVSEGTGYNAGINDTDLKPFFGNYYSASGQAIKIDDVLWAQWTNGECSWGTPTQIEGSLEITVSPLTWTEFYKAGASTHVHNLQMNSWYTSDNNSNKDYFAITNNGGAAIDILISSSDNWTGTGVTWHVSPIGDPGDHTIGIWAGLDSDSGYGILIKPEAYDVYNFLLTNLASSAHDHFGLKVFTCTSNGGNASMSGTVTLTAVVHT